MLKWLYPLIASVPAGYVINVPDTETVHRTGSCYHNGLWLSRLLFLSAYLHFGDTPWRLLWLESVRAELLVNVGP